MKQFATLKNALADDEFATLLDEEKFGTCYRALISPNSRSRLYTMIADEGVNPLNNMKSIPARCFVNNSGIEEVIIPASTQIIYDEAFSCSYKLTTVKFNKFSQLMIIRNRAFYQCYNLEEIDLPESLNQIHDKAFCGCFNLKRVKLGNNIEEIAPTAFEYCNEDLVFQVPKDQIDLIEFLESFNHKVETY